MTQKLALSLLLFLVFLSADGQVKVSIGWDKDTIELGGEVDLLLFVIAPSNVLIESVSGGYLDSLISGFQTLKMRQGDSTKSDQFEYADADILNFGKFSDNDDNGVFEQDELKWDKSKMNAEQLYSNKIRLRIWDPGQIIAQSPIVKYLYEGNTITNIQKQQAEIYVRPPIDIDAMEQDSFDIAPIKTIIKEPVEFRDYLVYIYIFTGLVVLWISYRLYRRYSDSKFQKPEEEVIIVIPAHKIALDKLFDLDQKKLWESDIKTYQSKLTYVVREYLENRFKIPALETTTEEIVQAIKNKNLKKEHIDEMRNILQVADLVKFAKSEPNVNIHQKFMEMAFSFVRETKMKEELEGV